MGCPGSRFHIKSRLPEGRSVLLSAMWSPLELNWVFPSKAGGAVADSPRKFVVGADHLVLLMQGGKASLNGRQQAFHSEILNAIRSYTKKC